jgi:hypothetical protein
MVIFHSYVKLPEGTVGGPRHWDFAQVATGEWHGWNSNDWDLPRPASSRAPRGFSRSPCKAKAAKAAKACPQWDLPDLPGPHGWEIPETMEFWYGTILDLNRELSVQGMWGIMFCYAIEACNFQTQGTKTATFLLRRAQMFGLDFQSMDVTDRLVYPVVKHGCEKNGKRGMLGHPKGLCWLLWFLGLCSMFLPYLWCFMWWGIWDYFAPNFHCWCSDWMRVGFV